jgi:hypothetical protein
MPFTSCTVTVNNIASLSDLPNTTDSLTSTQLKEKFDQASTDLKTYLNSTLLTELARTTSGSSATENIGGRTIPEVTGSPSISAGTLYSQLLALQTKIGSFVSGTGFMPTTGGTFTGSVLFPDGTQELPSISNSDDPDTGIYFPLANRVAITTNGMEAFRVDNNQRFVFGNTSNQSTRFITTTNVPNFQLIGDSSSTTSSGSWFLSGQYSDNNVSGRLYFTKSRSATKNTTAADGHVIVNSGDLLGVFTFAGSDGGKYVESARISVEVDGTPDISEMPGRIRFLTTAEGAATPTERMRITKNGNVGIATNSPGAKLHIDGDLLASSATSKFETRFATTSVTPDYQFFSTGAGSAILAGRFSADAASARIYFAKSRNSTTGTHTVVQSGDSLGSFSFGGSDGTNISEGARISVEVDGTPGTNDMPGRIVFLTTADGSATPTERMRISNTGAMFINTTSLLGGGNPQLNVNGGTSTTLANSAISTLKGTTSNASHINFANGTGAGTIVGTISTSGSTTSYGTTSDYRLKENVKPMQNAIEKINKINPVTYTWKRDGSQGQGFIAHELQAVIPEAVNGLKDAIDDEGNAVYQTMDASFIIATLLKAVQEQQQIIESLQTRIELLESKVN